MKKMALVLVAFLFCLAGLAAADGAERMKTEAGGGGVIVAGAGDPTGSDATIQGVVTDAYYSTPIYGAVVRVQMSDGSWNTTLTNGSGYYALIVMAGRGYQVTADKRGYSPESQSAPPMGVGDVVTINFSLDPNIALSGLNGRVFDASNSDPLPGARLLISGSRTVAGVGGVYQMDLPMGEHHTILAQADGYKAQYFSKIDVGGGPAVVDIYLEKESGPGIAPPLRSFGGRRGIRGFNPQVLLPFAAVVMLFVLSSLAKRNFAGYRAWIGGAVAAGSAVLLIIACSQPEIGDKEEIFQSYLGWMVKDGDVIGVNRDPAVFIGRKIDFSSVNELTVNLTRSSDGQKVVGAASGFDLINCALGPAACAWGVVFDPGGADPCDLDGDTAYTLTIEGIKLEDGSTISPVTVNFRTSSLPPGYVPDLCSDRIVPWWTIHDMDKEGIFGGAGDTITVIVTGVADREPHNNFNIPNSPYAVFAARIFPGGHAAAYSGQNMLLSPPYIPMVQIYNNSPSARDLGTLGNFVHIVDVYGNEPHPSGVALPSIGIPAWHTLCLYVGSHGESYYAYDDGGGVHTIDFTLYPGCSTLAGECKMMDPPKAFEQAPAATW